MNFRLFIFCWLLLASSCTGGREKLPDFTIEMPDGYFYQTKKIQGSRPAVFVFFSSTCRDCQEETKEILAKMDSLKHASFYFLTVEDTSGLNNYIRHFKFSQYTNIMAGRDKNFFMPIHFKFNSTPLTAIYDGDKGLRAVFKGRAQVSEVIKIVNNL